MRSRRHALQRSLWVVVPFRGIAQGKSRLAGALNAVERARFNQWLFTHTLRVVAAWQGGLSRCIVISGCARALRIASSMGANALREACPRGDLNRALARATREARRCAAQRVLVLSCDLPWLTGRALDTLLDRAARGSQWALATDVSGNGTNALLLNARMRFAFSYGDESRRRHVESACQWGYSITVIEHPEFARDVDTPNDLGAWQRNVRERSAL